MLVEIDNNAGFCFGVIKAVEIAEKKLGEQDKLYCIGDIVHNEEEINRLKTMGMEVISHAELSNLKNKTVLIRAHGEPPSTYKLATENGVILVDATCPVVLKLQERVRDAWEKMALSNGTVIIYGKKGHAEVIGLVGQTEGNAVIVEKPEDLDNIDFSKPVEVFSQTTKEPEMYQAIIEKIKTLMAQHFPNQESPLKIHNTICGQVANRKTEIRKFATSHDVIVFVSGKKSSNGKMLFHECEEANKQSHFISEVSEINPQWFKQASSVGISGATSTPKWLMEQVAAAIKSM